MPISWANAKNQPLPIRLPYSMGSPEAGELMIYKDDFIASLAYLII
jgi:hypothetical protein